MLLIGSGSGGGSGATLTAAAAVGGLPGQVVYADGVGTWQLAKADALATTRAYGFLLNGMTATFSALAINAGELEGTTAEWDAITGDIGGLTAGVQYFLSNGTAGNITKTPVASGFRVPVGKALSSTRMAVQIDECIKLAS